MILAIASIEDLAGAVNNDLRWPNGIIYYQYHTSVTQKLKNVIRQAMDDWESEACLEFIEESNTNGYVMFHHRPNEEYCTCDSIGHEGGQQDIVLGYSCQSIGDLLHTLGHVIGLNDEQNRRDRANYVSIQRDNIELDYEELFATNNDLSVGYLGVGYDYTSIMHLNAAAYAKRGLTTIEVVNKEEYFKQGSPKLGERRELSEGDILKVNRLYACARPGSGKCEKLQVTIGGIQQLKTNDGISHRVEIIAVNDEGEAETLSTSNIVYDEGEGDFSPAWNQMKEFEITLSKWQYFHIKVIGSKYEEKLLSMVETVPLDVGTFSNSPVAEATQVSYTYKCIKDGDDCHHCNDHNTRECADSLFNYTCHCEANGYGGKSCDVDLCAGRCGYNNGSRVPGVRRCDCSCPLAWSPIHNCGVWEARCLRVVIKHARGLSDRDSWFAGRSDPFTRITAYTTSGQTSRGRTSEKSETHSPVWHYTFRAGCNEQWEKFYFKVYDEDGPLGEDSLSSGQEVYLTSLDTLPARDYTVQLRGGSGTITFDIFYDYTM